MTGPNAVVDYDPSRDDPTWSTNGAAPPAEVGTPPPPAALTKANERDDNVFDMDEEAPPIVLNGMGRYGIEQGTVMQEPSQAAMRAFRRAFYAAQVALRPGEDLPADPTDEQIHEMIADRDWLNENMSSLEVDAFALLCGASKPHESRPEAPKRPEPGKVAKGTTEQARKAAATRHERAVADWETAMDEHRAKVAEWEAAWSGGCPTRDQLAGLPYRGQAKLFGYLYAKFIDPFGLAAGSTPSRADGSGDASTASSGSDSASR